jgi:membrane protease YdiL (CAAX protease family)/Flp pilus assembly protein TadD
VKLPLAAFLTAGFVWLVFSTVCIAQWENGQPIDQRSISNRTTDQEHYFLARKLIDSRLYNEAAKECERAIAINPTKATYYDELAYCLEHLLLYDEAIWTYERATLFKPTDASAYLGCGFCYFRKGAYQNAIDSLLCSIVFDPSNFRARRLIGYSFYRLRKYEEATQALELALRSKPDDFDANYWRGRSLIYTGQLEAASDSLKRALEIKPKDFDANFWRGTVLMRSSKFKEAVPNLEKAHELRQNDKAVRLGLFACYLATHQQEKAFRIFPMLLGILSGAFGFIYLAGLSILLLFSFRIRAANFPGFGFSLSWLVLFFEGQIAFLFLLGLISSLTIPEDVLAGIVLAGVPIILVAAVGFARQPWGKPFTWPFRLGEKKLLVLSLLLLLLSWLFNFGFAQLIEQITHQDMPLQRTIPLLRDALRSNPIIAFLAAGIVAPMAEEILFRGLIFGALQKWLQPGWVIFWTSLLFAFVHMEIVGLLPLIGLGALLGWVRFRTGSIGLPILLHASNNCLAMLALMLAQN